MNKKPVLFLILLVMLFVVVFVYSSKEKETETETETREVAVLVNGQPIYQADVDEEFATLIPEQRETTTTLEVLDFLIEKKLLLQEVLAEGIVVTQDEVDRLFTLEAQELMLDQGITKNYFMQRLAEQAAINKLLEQKTDDNFFVKKEEVFQIYDLNYKDRNISFEDAEEEILLDLHDKKRENLRVTYINSLKSNADIIVLSQQS